MWLVFSDSRSFDMLIFLSHVLREDTASSCESFTIVASSVGVRFVFVFFVRAPSLCSFEWGGRNISICIPLRKHFASRQKGHIWRSLILMVQWPSYRHLSLSYRTKTSNRWWTATTTDLSSLGVASEEHSTRLTCDHPEVNWASRNCTYAALRWDAIWIGVRQVFLHHRSVQYVAWLTEEEQRRVRLGEEKRVEYFCVYRMWKEVITSIFILAKVRASSSNYNMNLSLGHEACVASPPFFSEETRTLSFYDIPFYYFCFCSLLLRCESVLAEVVFLLKFPIPSTDVTSNRPHSFEEGDQSDVCAFFVSLIYRVSQNDGYTFILCVSQSREGV